MNTLTIAIWLITMVTFGFIGSNTTGTATGGVMGMSIACGLLFGIDYFNKKMRTRSLMRKEAKNTYARLFYSNTENQKIVNHYLQVMDKKMNNLTGIPNNTFLGENKETQALMARGVISGKIEHILRAAYDDTTMRGSRWKTAGGFGKGAVILIRHASHDKLEQLLIYKIAIFVLTKEYRLEEKVARDIITYTMETN